MKINKNDPRLTAYLLNEISNEDRLLVEQALHESVELKAELEMIKKSLGVLQNSAKSEDIFRLTDRQRRNIFSEISKSNSNFLQRFIQSPWGYITGGLITASFALMIFNHSLRDQVKQKEKSFSEGQIMATADSAIPAQKAIPMHGTAPKPAVPAKINVEQMKGASGGAQSLQKMEAQSFGARTGTQIFYFLIETKPAQSNAIYQKLQNHFQDCLGMSPKDAFQFNWEFQNKITALEPESALNLEQKSCLVQKLQAVLDPKSPVLQFKIQTVSK